MSGPIYPLPTRPDPDSSDREASPGTSPPSSVPTRSSSRPRSRVSFFDAGEGDTWSERAALIALLGYLVIAPFPYGEVLPGGMITLELFAFITLALSCLGRPRATRLAGASVPICALLAIVALGSLQLFAMPTAVVALFSPVSASIYRNAADVLRTFGRPAPAARISIAPTETFDAILVSLSYLSLFIAAALVLRTRGRRRLFVFVFLVSTTLHILVATLLRADLSPESDPSYGRLHGAFLNANHFAGYLEIALAVAFGLLWREVLHSRERGRRFAEPARRFEARLMHLGMRVLPWAIIAAAIGLTKSRGGILVSVLMTVVMLVIAFSHQRVRGRRWAIFVAGFGAFLAGIGFVALALQQQPILRFLSSDPRDPASDLRLSLWRLSIKAWHLFPIFGSGLGTYREAFRRVQPRDLDYLVEYAHSDPLQLLVTGGAIGLGLAVIAILSLLVILFRRWSRETHREESAMLLAGFGALLSLVLHGFVEFNLSMPAIPATLACVLGMAWAAGQEAESARREIRLVASEE